MRRGKYGAVKTGGHASRKEHRRALQLRLLEQQGEIFNLREQVPYELVPTQYKDIVKQLKTKSKVEQRVAERSVSYIADFVYEDADGNTIVEDTKGFRTPDYIIKRKLMLYVHGITIKEI